MQKPSIFFEFGHSIFHTYQTKTFTYFEFAEKKYKQLFGRSNSALDLINSSILVVCCHHVINNYNNNWIVISNWYNLQEFSKITKINDLIKFIFNTKNFKEIFYLNTIYLIH